MVKKKTFVIAIVLSILSTFLVTSIASGVFVNNYVDSGQSVIAVDGLNNSGRVLTKPEKLNYKAIDEIKSFIEENYYKSTGDVNFNEGAVKGLFEALGDPYSSYMNEKEFKEFTNMSLKNQYSGVGIMFEPGKDGFIHVVSALEGTPAHKAGITTGDIIYKVDGKVVDTSMTDTLSSRIKGKEGTKVTLTIIKKGVKSYKNVELTREMIKIKSVSSKMLKNGIGYIKISSFDENAGNLFNENLKKLGDIKYLIIDLRGNPGGLINTCVDVADRILGSVNIVSTEDRSGKKVDIKSDAAQMPDIPIVVLTDAGSASASEILAGALKDNGRAVIIGGKTFGKGIIQSVIPLVDGGAIKLTTAQYFTPSGESIHQKGIKPNIKMSDNPKTSADEVVNRAVKFLLSGK